MHRILSHGLIATLAVLCSACATVASGGATTQGLSIQTIDSAGTEVTGANCELKNDEGRWFITTPGTTTVHRSNKDMDILCKKEGQDNSSAQVVSRTKGSIWGNILLGGGVGAIIDHNNGAAYEYPPFLRMVMGEHNVKIDAAKVKADEAQGKGAPHPDAGAKTGAAPAATTASGSGQ